MKRAGGRVRADALLVDRGLAPTRAQAQALIMAGRVRAGERTIDKAGAMMPDDVELQVESGPRFVSRGGDKLDAALEIFGRDHGLEVRGRVCLDVGASTGGFTDCLLQRGAARVVAVDVGYGQIAQKLRGDARVEVRERVNARNLVPADFDALFDVVVVDASFISLAKLVVPIAALLVPEGALVALVKPQFEAGRSAASRERGVIRDEATRLDAIERATRAVREAGFALIAEVDSALRGPKGNLERFLYARRVWPGPGAASR
jgi:23S rRNA (cytidine1920-2'-O)/16S rRNA (cytidine1409-2'-O)-methyltransferase